MPWRAASPRGVAILPVQLPGRENRITETLPSNPLALVAETAGALAQLIRPPFALFGHSWGAPLAYALAHELSGRFSLTPTTLFVSAGRPPHLPPDQPPLHQLSDADLLTRVQALDGIGVDLHAHPKLVTLLTRILRADLALAERYAGSVDPAGKLRLPIIAFGGDSDPIVSATDLQRWSELTVERFEMQLFPGGHFYLNSNAAPLLSRISRELDLNGPAD